MTYKNNDSNPFFLSLNPLFNTVNVGRIESKSMIAQIVNGYLINANEDLLFSL